jgi:hypothetical protein
MRKNRFNSRVTQGDSRATARHLALPPPRHCSATDFEVDSLNGYLSFGWCQSVDHSYLQNIVTLRHFSRKEQSAPRENSLHVACVSDLQPTWLPRHDHSTIMEQSHLSRDVDAAAIAGHLRVVDLSRSCSLFGSSALFVLGGLLQDAPFHWQDGV